MGTYAKKKDEGGRMKDEKEDNLSTNYRRKMGVDFHYIFRARNELL